MNNTDFIKNVWNDNLYEEMAKIRTLIKTYPYVAMDTEFPGVIAKPTGNFKKMAGFPYQQLRCNVNLLNLIQLGISISDNRGNRPQPVHTWQFNLKFDLEMDMYSKESIELLQTAQIDFQDHQKRGISPETLGYLLITSGLVMSNQVYWIGFHASYDFAYLLKLLTGNPMPEKEVEFYKLLKVVFPRFYDYKVLIKNSDFMKKGLQEIGTTLGVVREGIAHQAGSDALLTSAIFFKSIRDILNRDIVESNMNRVFGIESSLS